MAVKKMALEEELTNETMKWLKKIMEERKRVSLADTDRQEFLKNMDAYISDSQHFLKQGNLIEAFEAVIWAWAIMSIGKDIGILCIE